MNASLDRALLRDISWVLVFKIIALIIIKVMFFSDPAAERLDVDSFLLGPEVHGE